LSLQGSRAILLAVALFAPQLSSGNDAIHVQVPAILDPAAPIEPAVRRECNIEQVVGTHAYEQVRTRMPGALQTAAAAQAGAGRFVQLTVTQVYGVGGGGWSGAKHITLRAQVMQQGREVAERTFQRSSKGGPLGGVSGTCPIMERIAVALGKDLALWLQGALPGLPGTVAPRE
jgi:hypothetical protein